MWLVNCVNCTYTRQVIAAPHGVHRTRGVSHALRRGHQVVFRQIFTGAEEVVTPAHEPTLDDVPPF